MLPKVCACILLIGLGLIAPRPHKTYVIRVDDGCFHDNTYIVGWVLDPVNYRLAYKIEHHGLDTVVLYYEQWIDEEKIQQKLVK